jgi:hypothetical protein
MSRARMIGREYQFVRKDSSPRGAIPGRSLMAFSSDFSSALQRGEQGEGFHWRQRLSVIDPTNWGDSVIELNPDAEMLGNYTPAHNTEQSPFGHRTLRP